MLASFVLLCASFSWSSPGFLTPPWAPSWKPKPRDPWIGSVQVTVVPSALSFLNGVSFQQETYENTSHQVHTLRRLIKEKEEAFQRRCHLEPSARGLELVGSEALARIGPVELSEGVPPSDLDLLTSAPPPEEALPLPPPPAPPLPPPPPPLPGKKGSGNLEGQPHCGARLKPQSAVSPSGRSWGCGQENVKVGGRGPRRG